jgi:hypothetical protein
MPLAFGRSILARSSGEVIPLWESQDLAWQYSFYNGAGHGTSVCMSGNGKYYIFGTAGDNNRGTRSGSVFIANKNSGNWTDDRNIFRWNGIEAQDKFGQSVSIDSDANYFCAGAPGDDDVNTAAGALYFYSRSGSTWSEQAKLTSNTLAANDQLGFSSSMSRNGQYAIAGAPGNYDSGEGSAYIFSRSGSTWTKQAKLTASDAGGGDNFGYSVSISSDGNYAIVGARGDGASLNIGSAYVFTRSGSTWTQQQKLIPPYAYADGNFGWDVAINSNGTKVVIGAPYNPIAGSRGGSAYVFYRSGGAWFLEASFEDLLTNTDNEFGYKVAINSAGTRVMITAPADYARGTISVYELVDSTWTIYPHRNGDNYGQKIYPTYAVYNGLHGRGGISTNADGTSFVIGSPHPTGFSYSNFGDVQLYEEKI